MKINEPLPLNKTTDPFLKRCLQHINYTQETGLNTPVSDVLHYRFNASMIHSFDSSIDKDDTHGVEHLILRNSDRGVDAEVTPTFANWVPLQSQAQYDNAAEFSCTIDEWLTYYNARYFMLENECSVISFSDDDTFDLRRFSNEKKLQDFAKHMDIAPYNRYATITNDVWLESSQPEYLWYSKEALLSVKHDINGRRDTWRSTDDNTLPKANQPKTPDIITKTQEWVKAVNWHQVEAVEAQELGAVLKIQKNVKLLSEQQQRLEKKLHQEVATLLQKPASRKAIEKLPESQRKLFLSQEKALTRKLERGISHGF